MSFFYAEQACLSIAGSKVKPLRCYTRSSAFPDIHVAHVLAESR